MVGAFSHKFSIAPSGETTDRIKKVRRDAKMGRTCSITMPSMVGILGRAPAVDENVWCLSRLWDCDNGNTIKQCYCQNNYGVVA